MGRTLKVLVITALAAVLVIGLTTTAGCGEDNTANGGTSGLGSIIDCEEYTGQGFEAGDPAPEFQFQYANGQTFSLSDFQGEVVLLNFWAHWCVPCASEMPFIQQVYEEWQEKGLVLISIHVGESAEAAADFVEEYNLSFPVLMDIDGTAATQYGVASIPMTLLIDQDGLIQGIMVGAFSSVEQIESGLSLFITE
jgi:peroxiredoxin